MELSQMEVAQKLNLKQGAYSRYELGQRQPDFDMLVKIAKVYDVSVDYLLGCYSTADAVDLCHYLLSGNYTINGHTPNVKQRQLVHDVVATLSAHMYDQ